MTTFVCETCKDTHSMPLHSRSGDVRDVMCTRCPVPCDHCRTRVSDFGAGPYCATTPCRCLCHLGKRAESHMNIQVIPALETFDNGTARIVLRVTVDGVRCQESLIASGPRHDVEELYAGEITMQELGERWKRSRRSR